jgi:hypothetical protein
VAVAEVSVPGSGAAASGVGAAGPAINGWPAHHDQCRQPRPPACAVEKRAIGYERLADAEQVDDEDQRLPGEPMPPPAGP